MLLEELAGEKSGVYRLLATDFRGDIPPNQLTNVIERVDREVVKLRYGGGQQELRERILALIHDVTRAAADGETGGQMEFPGL